MCYEALPFNSINFCHRKMVADWFAETGYKCEEFSVTTEVENLSLF